MIVHDISSASIFVLVILFSLGYGFQPMDLQELTGTATVEGKEFMETMISNGIKRNKLQMRQHQRQNFYYYNRLTVPFNNRNCNEECTTKQHCQSVAGSVTDSCVMNSYIAGVCCKVQQLCGKTTTDIVAVFNNPQYPDATIGAASCDFTMFTLPTTCGVRVDFLDTTLTPSLDGSCYADVIIILVTPPFRQGRYNTPFCGPLAGYSTLIQVNGSVEVKLIATTQSDQALWNIRLTQINCADAKLPDDDSCGFSNVNLRRISKRKLHLGNTISNINNLIKKDTNKMDRVEKGETRLQNKTRSNAKIKNILKIELPEVNFVESVNSKILNGHEALPYEYPWMVVLLVDNDLNCGATLISHDWVLTAGHCMKLNSNTVDIKRFSVLLGAHNISRNDEPRRIVRFLSNIVEHPAYQTANFDIALLRMSTSVRYNVAVRPVCLPSNSGKTYSADPPIVAGWGKALNNMFPQVLLATFIPLVNEPVCQAAWSSSNVQLQDFMLCAGAPGVGTCNGDSGGPLVVHDEDELYYVIGITSFGAERCDPQFLVPDVFTRVAYFRDWISLVLVGS